MPYLMPLFKNLQFQLPTSAEVLMHSRQLFHAHMLGKAGADTSTFTTDCYLWLL